ncbi:hypothetical protein Tco_1249658, partial [Tanacetum coccineum]
LVARLTALEKRNTELEHAFTIQNNTTNNLASRIFILEHCDLEDLSEIEMKEMLHQRMFEIGSYKSLPGNVALYEALEKSMARDNMDEFLVEKAKSRKRR